VAKRRDNKAYLAASRAAAALERGEPSSAAPAVAKKMPNYAKSGKLEVAEATNEDGVALKYVEPAEARVPADDCGWRLYEFKGKEQVSMKNMTGKSCFLVGNDAEVVDVVMLHPSVSKQHAAVQYRQMVSSSAIGEERLHAPIVPYVVDLDSTNGSKLNGEALTGSQYYELLHGDKMQFGFSSRKFVMINTAHASRQHAKARKTTVSGVSGDAVSTPSAALSVDSTSEKKKKKKEKKVASYDSAWD
jgi:smad nuclear-interacting protein 1